MHADCPYYISPHAVTRFQERVAALPAGEVREVILLALQKENRDVLGYVRWNRQVTPLYQGNLGHTTYFLPISIDMVKRDAWLVVPTVLIPPCKGMHWVKRNGSKKWFQTLWHAGVKKKTMANAMGISLSSVSRLAETYEMPPRRSPHTRHAWTDEEREAISELLQRGVSAKEIASYFSTYYPLRPSSSVRVMAHRMRLQIERNVKRCKRKFL